ncbi:MAG: O-antigen ligase family protein [Patescibacteria group bacterium]
MSKKEKHVFEQQSFLECIISWITVGVFAVLPLLYFSGRAASYVTSKQYFFMGTVELLVILWVWLMVRDNRYWITKASLIWLSPLLLFLISATISGIVGVSSRTSFYSTVESGTGLLLLYHVFVFACIIASLVRVQRRKIARSIMDATLFASVILAAFTFFTGSNGLFLTSSEMLNGSSGGAMMGNSLLVGAYFVFSIFFALILIFQESSVWKKALYSLAILFLLISPIYLNVSIFKGGEILSPLILLGQARVAAAALGIGLLVGLFVWLATNKGNKRIIGIAGLAVIGIAGIIFAFTIASPGSSLHTFFVNESGNRIVDWQASVKGIREKPLLGWGPENFNVVYQKYLDPAVFNPGRGNEVWALHPHNNTLEMFVNGGILGGMLYILFIAMLFVGLFRLYKSGHVDSKTFALLVGMLIAFILQQQMIYESIVSYVMLFSVAGIIAGLATVLNERKAPRVPVGTIGYVLAIGITVIIVPVWVYAVYFPAKKMKEYQAVTIMPSDARAKVYSTLFSSPGAYAINTDVEFYTDPLFYSYDAQKAVLRDNPVYKKVASEEITALIEAVRPIWLKSPYNYHLTLSLLQLENLLYYLTEDVTYLVHADMYAKKAFELSPSDPQIYFTYAQTLVYEKKIPEAISLLDKSIQINSNYMPSVKFKAILVK